MWNLNDSNGWLLIFISWGLLFLVAPVNAAITVTAGSGQQVPAGSPSADIFFKVTDATGNPNTSTTVNFSLIDPAGNPVSNGLSTPSASTSNNGLVSTRLNPTSKLGNYTITATLVSDTTQFTGINVVVVAGLPAKLTITEGSNQTLPAGQSSANIRFKLTDAFNNAVAGQVIHFTLRNPSGEMGNDKLFLTEATTDINGQVTTRVEALKTEGSYLVTATLATDETISIQVPVQIVEPIPPLPNLGFGMAFDTNGAVAETTASFNGGTKVNDGEFNQEVVFNLNDSISVQGVINVDSRHLGQSADIIIVASHNPIVPFNTQQIFYMFSSSNLPEVWDGNLAHLVAFSRVNSLPKKLPLNLYGGKVGSPGLYQGYFGYRLDNGLIVFNGNQTINLRVK
jgi:hypothetical protein